jgi:hypothetical protein
MYNNDGERIKTMNRDDDMNHLKSAYQLREELASGTIPNGLYGDSVGGGSFTDEEARILGIRSRQVRSFGNDWYGIYAGPGTTKWTVINCSENTEEELALYEEALASEGR